MTEPSNPIQDQFGPCAIRICARERGYELCSSCSDLESCTKFEWLGEYGQQFKEKLKESR